MTRHQDACGGSAHRHHCRYNKNKKCPPRPKPKRRFPPEVLTPEEVMRLMGACAKSPEGIRNRALIAVLYRSGLRINEALMLMPKDLDSARGAIRVLHAKGGRSRTAGMDQSGWHVLNVWRELRGQWCLDERRPLFCLRDGRALATSYIRVLFPRLGRRAGLVKRIHAHALRHTFAAELRYESIDIGIISKQLGHISIATTARYLDHIAPYSVVETIRTRRSPM